jgi:hypothetical protein
MCGQKDHSHRFRQRLQITAKRSQQHHNCPCAVVTLHASKSSAADSNRFKNNTPPKNRATTMSIAHFFRPLVLLALSASFAGITIFKLLASFNISPLFSWHEFRQHWFVALWHFFGPKSAAADAPRTSKLLNSAYGVVLDIGYMDFSPFACLLTKFLFF